MSGGGPQRSRDSGFGLGGGSASGLRPVQALLGAVSGFSVGGFVAGILVGGDFFDFRQPGALVPLLGGPLLGAVLGFRVRRRRGRIALAVVTALALLGWVCAPRGWWAKGPPPAPTRRSDQQHE